MRLLLSNYAIQDVEATVGQIQDTCEFTKILRHNFCIRFRSVEIRVPLDKVTDDILPNLEFHFNFETSKERRSQTFSQTLGYLRENAQLSLTISTYRMIVFPLERV